MALLVYLTRTNQFHRGVYFKDLFASKDLDCSMTIALVLANMKRKITTPFIHTRMDLLMKKHMKNDKVLKAAKIVFETEKRNLAYVQFRQSLTDLEEDERTKRMKEYLDTPY